MPLLTDVGAYLVSAGLGLTIGSTGNLFLGGLPEPAPDASVTLQETPGRGAEHAMGASLTAPLAGEFPRFQVVVRDVLNNYATARALAESIYLKLDKLADTTLGSARYLMVEAQQPPFYLAEDGNARHRFIANYEARKERG